MAKDSFDNKDELDAPTAKDGLGNALIFVTTIMLLLSFWVIERALAEKFNKGMFADDKVHAASPP